MHTFYSTNKKYSHHLHFLAETFCGIGKRLYLCKDFVKHFKKKHMKLVVMTQPTFFVEEHSILTTLFDAGMDNLHLYKPNSAPVYAERLLSLLPDDCYAKITVHDHYYLKEEYKLRGIHLEGLTEAPIGYKGNITRTCHSINELKDAKKKANYVFLDNVFAHDGSSARPAQEIAAAYKSGLIDKKVYALGGVTLETARIAREMGFGGVVVAEDLWDRFDIHNELDYKQLIAHFERFRKAVE